MHLLLTDPLWHSHPSVPLWGCCSAGKGHGWHRAQSLAAAEGHLKGTARVLAGAEGETLNISEQQHRQSTNPLGKAAAAA